MSGIFFLQVKCKDKEQRFSIRRILRELKDRTEQNYSDIILEALKLLLRSK